MASVNDYPAVLKITKTIGNSISTGTGTLLAGGKYILTAAHVVEGISYNSQLQLSGSLVAFPSIATVYQHPNWDSNDSSFNNDIAIIELNTAVTDISGLDIFRTQDYTGLEFTRVGFSENFHPIHVGTNIYDVTGEVLNAPYNRNIIDDTQILYDYDNGNSAQNALASYSNSSATPTSEETIANNGDSGGPALINGKIAGIASYVAALESYDVNKVADFSPGEIGADTKVASYQSWIDYITQGNPIYEAPSSKNTVQKTITEPDYGTVDNHFLLSRNEPSNTDIQLWYETIDGSAIAGQDYIASSGWVTLQAGTTSTAISVTIIGDQIAEAVESFIIQVSDPSGTIDRKSTRLNSSH